MPVSAQPGGQFVYGVFVDSSAVKSLAIFSSDSIWKAHPSLRADNLHISSVQSRRPVNDHTAEFYLLLLLCLILGVIRLINTRYFHNLIRAFGNATLSRRQIKDQLQSAPLPNLLMNLFFTLAGAAYMFYLVRALAPEVLLQQQPASLLFSLFGALLIIYVSKYYVLRLSGWAFHVSALTDQYLFDVFLVNKIIGIALLPFIILIAFAKPGWTTPLVIVSCVVVGLLLTHRYIRSWPVFASFFQNSRFQFFTYLCASEILPLAILMKLFLGFVLV